MATKLTTLSSGSPIPSAVGAYRSMKTTGLTTSFANFTTFVTEADGDKRLTTSFYSERVDAEIVIAGEVTFNVWVTCTAGMTIKARLKLSKVTGTGGGNVETLIGQQDSSVLTDNGVSTKYTFTFTPSSSITVAVGERFIMRIYQTPVSGSYGGASLITVRCGEDVDLTGNTWVQLTENVTFRPDASTLFFRRTAANGIGTFFDLLEARGSSAATTGVVNTTASGTEIQWTRTAGGTALEWITPRMQHPGWYCAGTAILPPGQGKMWCHESNIAANCTLRLKMFRRTPDGVETLVYTKSYTQEFTTTSDATQYSNPEGPNPTTTVFNEDDRMIIRAYIIPVGTMGGARTCTLTYDHNVALGTGDAYITFTETPRWKDEGDAAISYRVPGGMTMGGVGN